MTRILWLTALVAALALAGPGLAAPPDSTGVGQGAGTEDDPWLIDVDALLQAGYAVIVSDEDTVAVADAVADTIRVAAPRLRVSEVVRRIALAMEEADRALGPHRYTERTWATVLDHAGEPDRGERVEFTSAARIHIDPDGERRTVRLHSSSRTWKDGELTDTEEDDAVAEEWQGDLTEVTLELPFSLLTANRYRYEIRERTLIGEHLVFRIGFAPRNRFEPGLAGEVWIDYSDFVIRRMEGAMVGPMPIPLLMSGVPRFELSMTRAHGRWVVGELHALVELNGAMPGVPDQVELHVLMDDYEFGEVRP